MGGNSRPGDWMCPGCGANVFASKNECFKCQHPKPVQGYNNMGSGKGGSMGGGMGGGMSGGVGGGMGGGMGGGPDVRPGDWRCPSCGANVFASKTECFRCQTPKP